MKSCVVRKRFLSNASINESGTATTVDLDPGFGVPKACIIYYVDQNPSGDGFFDISTLFRTVGIGFIGSTDSSITSNLAYRCSYTTQMNAVGSGVTFVRRQNNLTRWAITGNTAGAQFWQGTTATFNTDQVTFITAGGAAPTNVHLDTVMTFLGGNDLTVAVGDTQFPSTANSSLAVGSLTFQPDVVLIATVNGGAGQGLTDDARFSFGAATRLPAAQKGITWHLEGNNPSIAGMNCASLSSSTVINTYSTSLGVATNTFSMGTFTGTGWSTVAGSAVATASQSYIYMALKSSQPSDFALLDISTSTTTGSVFTGTGSSGFVPRVLLGALTAATTDNTRATTSPNADGIALFAGHRDPYSVFYNGTGTLSVASLSTTVTGQSSEFGRLNQGTRIYDADGTFAGTISLVNSKTSVSFLAGSNVAMTTAPYLYANPNQYYVAVGNSTRAISSQVYSSIGSTLIFTARGLGAVPAYLDTANLQRNDTRQGFLLNYTTSSGSAKLGWVLAIKDTDLKRRGSIS
jgi:hypothetical protein